MVSDRPAEEILYLWTILETGVHSCYVVDSLDKAIAFLEAGIVPDNSRFFLSSANDAPGPEQLQALCELSPDSVVGPSPGSETLVSRVIGRKLFYHGPSPEPIWRSEPAPVLPEEMYSGADLPDSNQEGPAPVRTLAVAAEELKQNLNERKKSILAHRLTGHSPRKTLEETSEPFGISRERIRQIESEIVKEFARDNERIVDATTELLTYLTVTPDALSLGNIAKDIPELEGVESWWRLLMMAVGPSINNQVHLLEDHGVHVVSLIHPDEIAEIVKRQRDFLKLRVEEAPDYQVSQLLTRILSEDVMCQPGLADLILAEVLRDAHTRQDNGNEVIIAYGRGANAAVLAVLHGSDMPLTYEEVHKHLDHSYEIRRVHNALQEKAIQLGWGTYGLRKHIPFSESELMDVASMAEEAIIADDPERQWHAQEILEMVRAESQQSNLDSLTVYHVEYALSLSDELVSLRRMVWGLRSEYEDSADARVDRLKMVEQILEEAGRPLTNHEVKERADQIRGTGQYFQVYGGGRVIRVGRGLWGLRDRDVPWSDDVLHELTNRMFSTLEECDKGLFIHEVDELDFIPSQDIDQTRALSFLFCEDHRFALTQGGTILYLRQWGEPRRLTVKGAIRSVFQVGDEEYSRENLLKILREITGLELESSVISMALTTSPYCRFDSSTNLWVSSSDAAMTHE